VRKNMTASRTLSASLLLATATALASACSTETRAVYLGREDPVPTFTSPDAGDDAEASSSDTTTSYCPSNMCPPSHTTCPSSQFLCDVDLLTNLDNCGECGNECPDNGKFVCAEGRCLLSCNPLQELDCDGIPDNGCEASPFSNDNCGYCGNKCPADKPCIQRKLGAYGCGCNPGEILCGGSFLPCVNPSDDDGNCGACGNACPPGGDGIFEAPPNMYFGCFAGACGTLKCAGLSGNCDGNADNGCETSLLDDDNCGACGKRCEDGTTCGLKPSLAGFTPMCMCPKGSTFCGSFVTQGGSEVVQMGDCRDLSSDDRNCGGCGTVCSTSQPNSTMACVYGKCESSCRAGWGDCNGSPTDGCETNISSDPKNCGGCGIVCDGIAGQACVDGRCMVEPCDEPQDAGGPPR